MENFLDPKLSDQEAVDMFHKQLVEFYFDGPLKKKPKEKPKAVIPDVNAAMKALEKYL